jgi:hypothetical protein
MGKKRLVVEYVSRGKKPPVVKRIAVEKKADKLIAALRATIEKVNLALAVLKNKHGL